MKNAIAYMACVVAALMAGLGIVQLVGDDGAALIEKIGGTVLITALTTTVVFIFWPRPPKTDG